MKNDLMKKKSDDIDILQIEDEILREKLLNVQSSILIDKIEALNLTPSIPFVLEYPSSSSIPVVDSDFLIEEVDTFLVSEEPRYTEDCPDFKDSHSRCLSIVTRSSILSMLILGIRYP
ncbi:hypothetical protein Tco_0366563 [Tanacetum coccineum]